MCLCIVPVSACFVMSLSLTLVTQSCPTLWDPMDYSPQAPLSMKFSRQEFWSGLPFPSPGHLPSPAIEPRSPALQADSLLSEPQGKPFPWLRPCYLPLTDPYNYIGSTQRIQDILHLKMFNVIILRKFLCAMWKWTWRWKVKSLSHVRLFATPWTVAHKAPPSMGFSKQEYWSVLPFPSPGDLPDPGIEPRSPTMQADTLTSEPSGKPLCAM